MQESGKPMISDASETATSTQDGGALEAEMRAEAMVKMKVNVSASQVGETSEAVFEVRDFSAYYGSFRAVKDVSMDIPAEPHHGLHRPLRLRQDHAAALLQPHERPRAGGPRTRARSLYHGVNLYDPEVDPVEVRRRIGMVFQKPNPFPKSIYDNIAFGARIAGYKGNMDELVERSLRRAAIWDEVKDKLKQPGTALSGGQQQRLCIARAIAVEPDVILMDEPCSALDPVATLKIEELMFELATSTRSSSSRTTCSRLPAPPTRPSS